MYVHLRGEGAERGEGCSQGLGNLMLLFYHGWWSIWGNLLCDFTTKHLKRGDRDSSWEMAPAQLCAKLTKKHENEHLPLQLPVFIQRDVLGGVDQGPQAVCTHSGFSRSNQHALVSAENFPIWLYWWMLYDQLHFDTYQCENNSGTKAAGIPQSQQPNSEHHKRGNRWFTRSFVLFPNYTSIGITRLYKDGKGEFCCQRWVWDWKEGRERIMLLILHPKYALTTRLARIQHFPWNTKILKFYLFCTWVCWI